MDVFVEGIGTKFSKKPVVVNTHMLDANFSSVCHTHKFFPIVQSRAKCPHLLPRRCPAQSFYFNLYF